MNIGVIMPTWLGDVCMATPMLRLLREARPDGRIHVFTNTSAGALLEAHPDVDTGHIIEPRRVLATAKAVRGAQLNECWVLPGSFRWGLIARLSGVQRRIGYRRDGRGWLLTDAIDQLDRTRAVSTVEWYAHLVRQVCSIDTPTPSMHLHVTEDDRAQAGPLLKALSDRPYAVLVPGANRTDKRWPAEHFAAVARTMSDQHQLVSLVVGAPAEAELAATICAAAPESTIDGINAGTSIGALKAIIDGASIVVSNDTGPRHIALCTSTAVVSLFGPTDHRWTAIACPSERRLLSEPFLPESLVADRCAKTCRMDRIPVSDVCHAIDSLLARA
ncbi:MAG: lipopolysaccharide heptosyltransferase II [Phycisphaerales bacterium]|nr:lipopolysaccharide heptosyltransferase II [Phycisphaerales bacterium]